MIYTNSYRKSSSFIQLLYIIYNSLYSFLYAFHNRYCGKMVLSESAAAVISKSSDKEL